MINLKVLFFVSFNAILIYSTATIATNDNKSLENIKSSDCCSYRQKKAINDKSIHEIMTLADGVALTTDELKETNIKERLTVERNASPYIVARKGVISKSISARKGVDDITIEKTTETIDKERELHDDRNITYNNNKTVLLSIGINNITQLNIENTTEINSLNSTTIKHINTMKKKFRPKPTVTSVIGNDDNNSKRIIHSSPTKSPPLEMPSKINYVVPAIIIILILPLFIISMIYIYKNGRDCWEKRHYRRMDFLIDGMYNE